MQNTKEEKQKFSVVMWGVAEDFGGKISTEGLQMRFEALKEYSIEEIQKAGTWLLKNRTEKFPAVPTTKEFIDAIKSLTEPQISAGSKSEIQADIVLERLRYQGRNGSNLFDDKITNQLMNTRWRYKTWASEVVESELKWWRKEFVEAYKAYSEADKQQYLIEPSKELKKLIGGIGNGATTTKN